MIITKAAGPLIPSETHEDTTLFIWASGDPS